MGHHGPRCLIGLEAPNGAGKKGLFRLFKGAERIVDSGGAQGAFGRVFHGNLGPLGHPLTLSWGVPRPATGAWFMSERHVFPHVYFF